VVLPCLELAFYVLERDCNADAKLPLLEIIQEIGALK
jgi:hypothetical protein